MSSPIPEIDAGRKGKSFAISRNRDLGKAGKKGGAKMKSKARERVMKDVLAVDFSKPYQPKEG